MRADDSHDNVYVIASGRRRYEAWKLTPDGVGPLQLPRGPAAGRDFGLAWTLLFDATGDGRLADDWCEGLALELSLLRRRRGFSVSARQVAAWLEQSV